MPSVVRSSVILGALALAVTSGLTACGDKVNVTQTPVDSTVHQVVVSPPSATMNVGDKVTFAASVSAGVGQTNLNVTWSSSNTAVATVDANGVTTAVGGGTASIIAASAANPAIKGAAVVTVGAVVQPTVTIASINQTTLAGSVPANLGNVVGQLDVTLNVDPGTQKLSEVDLVATVNGKDTTVASQVLSSSDLIPAAGVEAASAPITLSFNTAFFNSTTGAVNFRNGQITIKGVVHTTQGTQTSSSLTQLTLNNPDVLIGTVSSAATAVDVNALAWQGGAQTVTVIPVFYTPNRSAVNTTIALTFGLATGVQPLVAKSQNVANPSGGAVSATFTSTRGTQSGTSTTDISQITNTSVGVTAVVVDNNGASFANAVCNSAPVGGAPVNVCTAASVLGAVPAAAPTFRLDTQKPAPGTFSVTNNIPQNIVGGTGYVGAAFVFNSTSAAGYTAPNPNDALGGTQGVGKPTVVFQFANNGSTTFTTVTNTQPISESVANNSYNLRMITTDALGNADTTGNASSPQALIPFGVDKTPPTVTVAAAPANQAVTNTTGALGNYSVTISDNLSGTGPALAAQVRNWNGLSTVSSANEGRQNTNVIGTGLTPVNSSASGNNPCVIGRFNASQANAGANALAIFNAAGTAIGFCTPIVYTLAGNSLIPATESQDGYWQTEVIAQDVAANQTAAFTRTVYEDATAPTVINIDPPPTAVGNGSVAFPTSVTDNAAASAGDIVGSFFTQTFAAGVLQYPTVAGPGTAFDNVLTNAPVLTPTFTNYIKNIQTVGPAAAAVAPVSPGNDNTAVTVTAIGAADVFPGAPSRGSLTYTFQPGAPQLVAGSTTTWPNGLTAGWTITGNNATVSNCPTAGCAGNAAPAHPTSTTLTVTAIGATQTFANPLVGGAVNFWYRPTGSVGPWFFAGAAGAGASRDNGTNRFWDFSFTFTPPKSAPDGTVLTGGASIDVVAIGVNTAGDAIMNATVFTVTLTNP